MTKAGSTTTDTNLCGQGGALVQTVCEVILLADHNPLETISR